MPRKDYVKLFGELVASVEARAQGDERETRWYVGADYAERNLESSRWFLEDRDPQAVKAAAERFAARVDQIVQYVAAKWGEPTYRGDFFKSPFPTWGLGTVFANHGFAYWEQGGFAAYVGARQEERWHFFQLFLGVHRLPTAQ